MVMVAIVVVVTIIGKRRNNSGVDVGTRARGRELLKL